MTLTLLCGHSFSGKSTLAAGLAELGDAEVINLDQINAARGLDGSKALPLEEWAKTNDLAHRVAAEALRKGRHVIVDDTGSPCFIRDAWREVAAEAGTSFSLVWVTIDSARQRERVLANREKRGRMDVSDDVLAAHGDSFEPPTKEDPILVDADDTADPDTLHRVALAVF
ncbi:putative kinase [Friedmanniella endophytica]|uniref:Putative kinase n=1 Tax=Microlunatus kandeliicorticis TaxID=1759536 RepID=A0A7W3IRV7_9ACTN|nr:ATP-binding protein [Microlunatus kandeliicorticis]MBA8794060.1 putative kinase [Microlunatus kandeliicorticis]